jgi:hypothetical protein
MKKISAPRILKSVTDAAQGKGITIQPGSQADKTTRSVINTSVDVANKGISLGNRLAKKGSKVLEEIREKVHEATAPRPNTNKR